MLHLGKVDNCRSNHLYELLCVTSAANVQFKLRKLVRVYLEKSILRNLCNNKKVSKFPRLSKFADDLSQQSCKKHISDSHVLF